MTDIQETVDSLLKKAAMAGDSGDALRFSQAALNAAHAQAVLKEIGS